MRSTLIIAFASTATLALSSCNEAAPPANAAPESGAIVRPVPQPPSPVPAPQTDPWTGQYSARIEGGTGTTTIQPASGAGRYDVEVVVTGAGNSGSCGGSAGGRGTARGNVMSVTVAADFVEEGHTCQMTLIRTGNRIAVGNGTCPNMTGMSCTLEGSYTRTGGGVSAPKATISAAQPLRAWIVGVWAPKDSYCASGDPIKFAAQGGYSNSGGDVAGRWSLSGSTVTVTFAEQDPTGGPAGAQQTVRVPIAKTGADEMRFGKDRMKRCPAKGGTEPWHPGQRFEVN